MRAGAGNSQTVKFDGLDQFRPPIDPEAQGTDTTTTGCG